MANIGDEITKNRKTYVYIGGGKWNEKPAATATIEKQDELITELEKKSDLIETQPVSVATLPLPTGAATAAKQLLDNHNVTVSNQISTTGLATSVKQLADNHNVTVSNQISVATLATSAKQLADNHNVTVSNISTLATSAKQDTLLTEMQKKADLTETQPVSLATAPLPTGAATAANQTNGTQAVKFVDEAGNVYGVKHVNYKPRVSSMPYLYDIAEGNVSGHDVWSKIGYNDAIGTSEETMWSNSSQYVFPTVAGQMEVVSSSDNDGKTAAPNSTGAKTVRIGYLKSDYSESSVTITLDGTTAVATGASHADIWRINSFHVMTTGTNNAPVGNLTLRPLGGGTTFSYIRLGKTRARACFYTVPLGKTLYISSIAYSAVGTKYLIFTNHANYDITTNTILQRGLFHPFSEVALLNSAYTKELTTPTKIPATVDIKVSVIAEAAGSLATCHLRGWIE